MLLYRFLRTQGLAVHISIRSLRFVNWDVSISTLYFRPIVFLMCEIKCPATLTAYGCRYEYALGGKEKVACLARWRIESDMKYQKYKRE